MKLSIRENLSKFNLINEGWMDSLSNKYDEDTLIFTGRMLQQAFGDEDISNHPMAEWIAKSTKSFGKFPWNEGKINKIEQSFQEVLNFIKNSENPEENVGEIMKMNPKDAIEFVVSSKDDSAVNEIEALQNDGNIKIIKKIGPNKIWIEILQTGFFNKKCKSNSEYGIACQVGSNFGKFVGNGARTYTLLGREKDKGEEHFLTLASISVIDNNRFFEIKQPGNAYPGSQSVGSYNGSVIAKEVVDFITTYSEVRDITKYVDFFNPTQVPSQDTKYGGGGTYAYWVKKHPELIGKIISANPHVVGSDEVPGDMRPFTMTLNPDLLETIDVDLDSIATVEPEKLFDKIKLYLSIDKEKMINILENFNYEDFIKTHGIEKVEKALLIILENISFESFINKIYHNINFRELLSKYESRDIKEIIRKIRNKFDKNTKKFLEEFERLLPDFLSALGGGSPAFAKIFNILNIPRLNKHQNYELKKDGSIVAMVEGPSGIENKEIPEAEQILGRKLTKSFLEKNKDKILEELPGDDAEEKESNFNRMLLKNLSKQEKQSLLNKKKDSLISQFEKEYKSGKNKIPGFIRYNYLINPEHDEVLSPTEENKKLYPEEFGIIKVDKKDFKTHFNDILRYFYKSNNDTGYKKYNTALYGTIQVAQASGIHENEIEKLIPTLLKFSEKKGEIDGLIDFVVRYLYGKHGYSAKDALSILNRDDIKKEVAYKEFLSKLKEDEKKSDFIENIEKLKKEGYNTFKIGGSGKEFKEENILRIIKADNYNGNLHVDKDSKTIVYHLKADFLRKRYLNEEKVRKYIQNLFESSLNK